MPRPCAVEAHARSYREREQKGFADATALRRGGSRSRLPKTSRGFGMPRPCAVEAHARGYREASEGFCGCHGLATWHLRELCSFLCSSKRETPRRKAGASSRVGQLSF